MIRKMTLQCIDYREPSRSTKEAAKQRQDKLNKDKLEFAEKGGKVVIL